jgi:hypothetical protein
MFSKKRIKELEDRIKAFEESQLNFNNEIFKRIDVLMENDKAKFMYELRQEDLELIEDGKKIRKIRKILN